MYHYIAQFLPNEEQSGVYNVSFPDLLGCDTFGFGMDEAMQAAMDALTGYLDVEIVRDESLPEPSDRTTVVLKAEIQAQNNGIMLSEDTQYTLVLVELKHDC